jgi:hypothetical protein
MFGTCIFEKPLFNDSINLCWEYKRAIIIGPVGNGRPLLLPISYA